MRCKSCGKVVRVATKYHCWQVAQQCGACHYVGGVR